MSQYRTVVAVRIERIHPERKEKLHHLLSVQQQPWFCKQLPEPSTDDIELRNCADESLANEDVPIEVVEIFVR